MYYKMRHSIVFVQRVLLMVALSLALFLPFSVRNPYLLIPSRTSIITLCTFYLVYFLMTRVYGGLDIGERKSRPIVYSLGLCVAAADVVTHLYLCVMNTTVVHGGRFVYEQPYLLALAFALQLALIWLAAYGGNALYFHFVHPKKTLFIVRPGTDAQRLIGKVGRYRRQYTVDQVASSNQQDLFALIDRHDAIFLCNLSAEERVGIVEHCYRQKKDFYYTMEVSDLVSIGSERTMFDDISVIHYNAHGLRVEQRIVKRTLDVLCSLAGLIVASPIMLAVALAIKLDDGGHVFYRQPRATYRGRAFNVIKFRSMREAGSVHRSASKDDDRVTRVGRFIRKFRLDELPQLFNVLRGDMSLVGPRPEMLENVEKYTSELPEVSYRLWAKAGLTGMAQVYGKYNTTPKEKLMLDMVYIERYSLLLDIKLILRTVMVLLTPDESTEGFDAPKPVPAVPEAEQKAS